MKIATRFLSYWLLFAIGFYTICRAMSNNPPSNELPFFFDFFSSPEPTSRAQHSPAETYFTRSYFLLIFISGLMQLLQKPRFQYNCNYLKPALTWGLHPSEPFSRFAFRLSLLHRHFVSRCFIARFDSFPRFIHFATIYDLI